MARDFTSVYGDQDQEEEVMIPPHPLGIKPSGNAFSASYNSKSVTGYFTILTDDLLIQILELLDAPSLLCSGATCKALYAFSRFEDLWKSLLLRYAFFSLRNYKEVTESAVTQIDII